MDIVKFVYLSYTNKHTTC